MIPLCRYFLRPSCSRSVTTWQRRNGDQWSMMPLWFDRVENLLFSGNGSRGDNTIKIWRIHGNQSKLIQTLDGHQGGVISLWYDRVHTLLFSGGGDNTIKIWRIHGNESKLIQILEGHKTIA